MRKVIQILTHLNLGDAIGNDVLAIDDTLRDNGYECEIMAITVHDKLKDRGKPLDFPGIQADDVIIFHKATGDGIHKKIVSMPCRKVMIYHNITPPKYFIPYDLMMSMILKLGRIQIKKYASKMDMVWGDSEYNCKEIIGAGTDPERVDVLPILFDAENRSDIIDETVGTALRSDPGTKLLFIGRIAPNKKIEDVIKVYYKYLKSDKDATLYLVGSWEGMDKYFAKLKGFCFELGLSDSQVVFTGHVSEAEKNSYLRYCDVLVCMSEHEGFCVPLLEAIKYDLPIVAYAAAAVPETLGESGLLFKAKDYDKIAEAIKKTREDHKFREEILAEQRYNLDRFNIESTRNKLLLLMERINVK